MSGSASLDVLFAVTGPDPEEWRDLAACRDLTDVDFFPPADDPPSVDQARAVCASCGVQEECLAFALHTGQPDGVWGGLTTRQRNRLRREWLRDITDSEAS